MDSEDSRPESSASNSSSNASENSTQTPNNEEPKSPQATSLASPASSGGGNNACRRSRQPSSSSQEAVRSPRSPSKSGSESSSSSSSSSDNEDDDAKSAVSVTKTKSKESSERSSSVGSVGRIERSDSCNESVSPVKSRRSSRNSSESTNNSRSHSRSNSRDVNPENAAINISHEDLSDVSDMDSEKRASSFNNIKLLLDDEGTIPSSAVRLPTDTQELEPNRHLSIDGNSNDATITDLRQKLDQKKNLLKAIETNEKSYCDDISNENGNSAEVLEDLVKTHDEDALDFEAEEGECQEVDKNVDSEQATILDENNKNKRSEKSDGEAEEGEELEEGEVTDEEEKRPEETEPKPVCRFYTRGQCTWGMSCRFLHPGVTDKGNYTMFDLVRAVPVSQGGVAGGRPASSFAPHPADYHDFRTERPTLHHRAPMHHHQTAAMFSSHSDPRATISSSLLPDGPVVVESAWERGLRTAKEMMRKANKRKEQDMDFEDKKMNLTLSPDELEKDPYYLKERTTPPDVVPPYGRHGQYQEAASGIYSPPERFARGPPVTTYDEVDPYGRSTRYRELPPHRMPQYEDERRVRPTREVIVQRVEPIGRGDEWNDPWMRSKSPGGRASRDRSEKRRRDRRSYSSNSSYSSSSSSQSDTSSDSSRSPSPPDHRRRYNSGSNKSPTVRRQAQTARSSSSAQRRTRQSPSIRPSPIVKRRGHKSPSPVIDKRSTYSPVHKRKKLSPIPKKSNDKIKLKRRHTSSSSGTGSSDSSASESDSDSGSSSSGSSSRSRGRAAIKRTRATEKVTKDRQFVKKDPPKKRSPISIEIKKLATVGASALTSPTNSISSEKDSKKTRREELLKQLRAVEDAIAKKRSKLT